MQWIISAMILEDLAVSLYKMLETRGDIIMLWLGNIMIGRNISGLECIRARLFITLNAGSIPFLLSYLLPLYHVYVYCIILDEETTFLLKF